MPKRQAVEDSGPSKAWLDSYADAMTLLLAFFVLLYAFSITDEKKFAEFKFGVESAFSFANPAVPEGTGFLDEGLGIHENAGQVSVVPSDVQNEIEEMLDEISADQMITPNEATELKEALEAQLGAAIDITQFEVETDQRGVVITLDEQLLFDSGSASIDTAGIDVLGEVAAVLAGIDNQIAVDGHTDSVPTDGSRWPTNWELSAARATSVVRVFNETYGLAGTRLSATGYSDTRPVDDNSTDAGRQANRRSELIVILDPQVATITDIPIETGLPNGDVIDVDPVVAITEDVDITAFADPIFSN